MVEDGRDRHALSSEQLEARVDKMLAAGRITDEDAARVRAAAQEGDAAAVVEEIRRRHAAEWIERAVKEGNVDQAEAAALLERLERGEDPRALRELRRRKGRP